jgi:FkbM family methyltransferase
MRRMVGNLVKKALKRADVAVVSHGLLTRLREASVENRRKQSGIELILDLPKEQSSRLVEALSKSKAQVAQDLFVLSELDFKEDGFFVEFGATNGIHLSNTYLLESEYGWRGILAEPARCWHEDLKKNRSGSVETDCVWKESDMQLTFNEVEQGDLSTIDAYSMSDSHGKSRSDGKTYKVRTISLEGLLEKHKAPREIDYLSIDTEGSEFQILSTFNFDKYRINIITCEHNFSETREQVYALLSQKGYVRKHVDRSRFDDWYVRGD